MCRAVATAGAVKFVSLKEYLAVAKTQGSAPTVNYIDRKARAAALGVPTTMLAALCGVHPAVYRAAVRFALLFCCASA
jgi:hypothetical protein